jgi:hypothetical protein
MLFFEIFNNMKYPKSLIFKPGVKLKLTLSKPGLILILGQKIEELRGYFGPSSNLFWLSQEENLMKKQEIKKNIMYFFTTQ